MTLLILGLALWYATHLWRPLMPESRKRLDASLGLAASKGVMAVATIAAVTLMYFGYAAYYEDGYAQLWTPPGWTTHLNNLLMVFAVAFFVAGSIPGHLRSWVRHTQLTAVKIWALAHLLVNGHLGAVILFGGLLAWAVIAMIALDKRDGKGPKPTASGFVPDIINAVVALAVFAVITIVHNWAGVSPFGTG